MGPALVGARPHFIFVDEISNLPPDAGDHPSDSCPKTRTDGDRQCQSRNRAPVRPESVTVGKIEVVIKPRLQETGIDRIPVHAVLKRDANAAVSALSEHFLTTMHLVELADAGVAAGNNRA